MYRKDNGISLLTLVIMIVLLLIFATIIVFQLKGENGLLSKKKLAKEQYSISEAKEKLELAILDLRVEQESKGEILKKEDLPLINSEQIDVRETESFPVEVIFGKYKFNIDENFDITYIGEIDGTIVTYITEPEGYTNKDFINILITVNNEKGIKSIKYPNGDEVLCNGKIQVGIDYTVTANGTYTFKVIDNQNREVTKDVVIYKIDKLKPLDFIPIIEVIKANGFQIMVDAKDAEETEESAKSGIEIYKCYIKKKQESDDRYVEHIFSDRVFEINGLDPVTEYDIYVSVYDRANNSISSQKITESTKDGPKDIYIDSANGSDETGDGSQERPYKNLSKIVEHGIINKGLIYNIFLQDGKYQFPKENAIIALDNDRSVNIFGNEENTILELPYEGIGYNDGNGGTTAYSLNFYKMVMKLNKSERSNYWCSKNNITFNNIVFDFRNTATYYGDFIVGDLNSSFIFNNCISIGKNILLRCNGGKCLLNNCYGNFKSGYYTSQTQWDYQTNYITDTPQIDTYTYSIIEDEDVWKNVGTGTNPDGSQANLGVYGGEYSWE